MAAGALHYDSAARPRSWKTCCWSQQRRRAHCLTVSLVDLTHFSGELARLLLLQPRAVLRLMDASAVAAQALLVQRGALAATLWRGEPLACMKAADLQGAQHRLRTVANASCRQFRK